MIVANKPYTDQLYFQELTLFLFTSVYFDITESSEVQLIKNTLKKRNLRTKQWNPLSLRLFSLASMNSWSFSNRTAHAWSVEARNICSVSVFFVRVGSQISPRRAKKDSNIPSPGRTRSVKCPTPGTTKTIKSHPMLPPPHPLRLYIDRCINLKATRWL